MNRINRGCEMNKTGLITKIGCVLGDVNGFKMNILEDGMIEG